MTEKVTAKFKELKISVLCLEGATENYIKKFSQNDFYSFSQSKERKEKYKKAYIQFSLSLAKEVPVFMRLSAPLASLLFEADRTMNEENAKRLSDFFSAHEAFEKALDQFTEKSEAELTKEQPSPSALLDCARVLARSIAEIKSIIFK